MRYADNSRHRIAAAELSYAAEIGKREAKQRTCLRYVKAFDIPAAAYFYQYVTELFRLGRNTVFFITKHDGDRLICTDNSGNIL